VVPIVRTQAQFYIDNFQGQIVETNWRATHILTGNQDIVIIPNSVIAELKLVNCSTPRALIYVAVDLLCHLALAKMPGVRRRPTE
jgi:small-conductance mechanosensitive channel